jgi:hypothetical protein
MVLFNGIFLVVHEGLGSIIFINAFVAFWFVLLSLALGRTLDKKLTLLAFRFRKWLLKQRLIEEVSLD